MDICYSKDNEHFYDDLEEVADHIRCDENLEEDIIYVAEKRQVEHSDFININYLIESMQENAYDNFDECFTHDYLTNFKDEYGEELKKMISNYIESKIGKPRFCGVKNVFFLSA